MSERVEREFKEMKEKYEIPEVMDFHLKTLLNLREEYDNIVPAGDNTKRREALLDMIKSVQNSMYFKEKEKYRMYVDAGREADFWNCKVYLKEQIISIQKKTVYETADALIGLSMQFGCEIYIDSNGLGRAIVDEVKAKGVRIQELKINRGIII